MRIGYARVSTHDQNLDLQKDALEKAGCEKILVDQVSGTVAARPGLERTMELLRAHGTGGGPARSQCHTRVAARIAPRFSLISGPWCVHRGTAARRYAGGVATGPSGEISQASA